MTIDSNIIIAYLTGEEAIVEILSDWRKQGGVMYLPTVVETEILCFDKWTEQ